MDVLTQGLTLITQDTASSLLAAGWSTSVLLPSTFLGVA